MHEWGRFRRRRRTLALAKELTGRYNGPGIDGSDSRIAGTLEGEHLCGPVRTFAGVIQW